MIFLEFGSSLSLTQQLIGHGESRHVKTWLGARSKQEFDFSESG